MKTPRQRRTGLPKNIAMWAQSCKPGVDPVDNWAMIINVTKTHTSLKRILSNTAVVIAIRDFTSRADDGEQVVKAVLSQLCLSLARPIRPAINPAQRLKRLTEIATKSRQLAVQMERWTPYSPAADALAHLRRRQAAGDYRKRLGLRAPPSLDMPPERLSTFLRSYADDLLEERDDLIRAQRSSGRQQVAGPRAELNQAVDSMNQFAYREFGRVPFTLIAKLVSAAFDAEVSASTVQKRHHALVRKRTAKNRPSFP